MLRFFRQIRKKLMEQNKVRTYTFYALGEIFLVVIGILIALQVNNWNEEQSVRNQANGYLKNMQSDLLIDLDMTNAAISFYEQSDSLFHIVKDIRDTTNLRERDDFIDLVRVPMHYMSMSVQDRGFNQLTNLTNELPSAYTDLLDEFSVFYRLSKNNVDRVKDIIQQTIIQEYDDLRSRPWYAEYMDRRLGNSDYYISEFLDYAINDPIRRNRLYTYHGHIVGDFMRVRAYNLLVQVYYIQISDFLGEEDLPDTINIQKVTGDKTVEFLMHDWINDEGESLSKPEKIDGEWQYEGMTLYQNSSGALQASHNTGFGYTEIRYNEENDELRLGTVQHYQTYKKAN